MNQPDFPPELKDVATSLKIAAGTEFDRNLLLKAIAGSIDSYIRILETSGTKAITSLFTAASSYVQGRRVAVDLPAGPVRGVTAGLNEDGFLLLDCGGGTLRTITSGGVRPDDGE